ncbi:DUF3106 domain-containing protein [Pseudorhodoferax sp.]|uniref:DUF3106 domain-containing protein n=1 Tax=Pseudorhodoferax sp. TaxID=1993553 RepID=UPI0039E53D6E
MPALAAAPQKTNASPAAKASDARPRWNSLTSAQRHALKPLAGSWNKLSESHRRKWIALSRNFDQLPPQEQQKLQQRMLDWVKLSPAERAQARLNFAETGRLAKDDKQAMWEAYQALSEEERRKLAAQAPRHPVVGAATAVRLMPPQRMATVPLAHDENRRTMPRISTPPYLVDAATLLPQIDPRGTRVEPSPAP